MILLSALLSSHTFIALSQTKEKKIILWQYARENSRESYIQNEFEYYMSHTKIADSLYYTKIRDQHQGPTNIDIKVDLLHKKISYIADNMESAIEENRLHPIARDTFKTKYVDNKFFRLSDYDKKYFVYRFFLYRDNNDFDELIYWSKDFGVILQVSLYNDYLFKVEYIDDDENNKIINHICFLIFGDKFFNHLDDWEKLKK